MDKLGITIHFPKIVGIFDDGILAALGSLLGYFFLILTVIWIGFSIYAGYKIILGRGDPKEMETGFTLVKNVWISVSWGFLFFLVLSIIGAFTGIGNITQWYYQLAQCEDASGGFYFLDRSAQQILELPTDQFYCCKVGDISGSDEYSELGYRQDTYHYIGVKSGTKPNSSMFSECYLFN